MEHNENFDVFELLERGMFQELMVQLQAYKFELKPEQTRGLEYLLCVEQGNVDRATEILVEIDREGSPFLPSIATFSWVCDGIAKRRLFSFGLKLCDELAKKCDDLRLSEQRIRFLSLTRNFQAALDLLREIEPQLPLDRKKDFGVLEARLCLLLGEEEEALILFRDFLPNPDSRETVFHRAIKLALKQKVFGLVELFSDQAISIFGDSALYSLMLAKAFNNKEHYKRTVISARHAIEILDSNNSNDYSTYWQCYELVAVAQMKLRLYDDALNTLLQCLDIGPAWGRGKILVIKCCLALDNHERARHFLNELLEENPMDPDVLIVQQEFQLVESSVDAEIPALNPELLNGPVAFAHNKTNAKIISEITAMKVPDVFMPQWSRSDLGAGSCVRKGLSGHFRSIGALLLRETRTRFVRHKMGALWMFIEPLAQASLMVLIFLMINRQTLYGLSIPLFIITGLVPFLYFSSTFSQMTSAVTGNRDLLMHPRVQTLDVILARAAIETLAVTMVFVVFLIVIIFFGEEVNVEDVVMVIFGFLGLLCCAVGLGLITAGIKIVLPGVATIIQYSVRLLFFTSGVFFAPEMVAPQLREVMMVNPLLHYISMIRSNFTPLLGYDNIDFIYAFIWALGMLTFGFIFERTFRFRMMSN